MPVCTSTGGSSAVFTLDTNNLGVWGLIEVVLQYIVRFEAAQAPVWRCVCRTFRSVVDNSILDFSRDFNSLLHDAIRKRHETQLSLRAFTIATSPDIVRRWKASVGALENGVDIESIIDIERVSPELSRRVVVCALSEQHNMSQILANCELLHIDDVHSGKVHRLLAVLKETLGVQSTILLMKKAAYCIQKDCDDAEDALKTLIVTAYGADKYQTFIKWFVCTFWCSSANTQCPHGYPPSECPLVQCRRNTHTKLKINAHSTHFYLAMASGSGSHIGCQLCCAPTIMGLDTTYQQTCGSGSACFAAIPTERHCTHQLICLHENCLTGRCVVVPEDPCLDPDTIGVFTNTTYTTKLYGGLQMMAHAATVELNMGRNWRNRARRAPDVVRHVPNGSFPQTYKTRILDGLHSYCNLQLLEPFPGMLNGVFTIQNAMGLTASRMASLRRSLDAKAQAAAQLDNYIHMHAAAIIESQIEYTLCEFSDGGAVSECTAHMMDFLKPHIVSEMAARVTQEHDTRAYTQRHILEESAFRTLALLVVKWPSELSKWNRKHDAKSVSLHAHAFVLGLDLWYDGSLMGTVADLVNDADPLGLKCLCQCNGCEYTYKHVHQFMCFFDAMPTTHHTMGIRENALTENAEWYLRVDDMIEFTGALKTIPTPTWISRVRQKLLFLTSRIDPRGSHQYLHTEVGLIDRGAENPRNWQRWLTMVVQQLNANKCTRSLAIRLLVCLQTVDAKPTLSASNSSVGIRWLYRALQTSCIDVDVLVSLAEVSREQF